MKRTRNGRANSRGLRVGTTGGDSRSTKGKLAAEWITLRVWQRSDEGSVQDGRDKEEKRR